MLYFKIILLVGLLVGSVVTTTTIQCSSDKKNWCRVHDSLENPSNGQLTINSTDRNNIKYFQWFRQSISKQIPAAICETFPNLEVLDLTLGIQQLHETDFRNAKKLSFLFLTKNEINCIPTIAFEGASNLVVISIDINKISQVQEFAFAGLKNLIQLNLDFNFITSLERNIFAGATKLQWISLKNNQITSIERGTFDLPRLKHIDLSSNFLQTIPDHLFANAPLLTHLDLTNNYFRIIPQALFSAPRVEHLVFGYNDLEHVQISEFIQMKKLNYLSLESTGISFPTGRQWSSESVLTQIDLTDNRLTDPDILKRLGMFGRLQDITLRFNKLTRLDDVGNVRRLFPNITKIVLIENEFDWNWFSVDLPRLQNLGIEVPIDWTAEMVDDLDGQLSGKFPK